jgi:adenosylhomocysteine nucleosidase
METAGVLGLCGERGVRALSVRVISDEAGVDLPPEVLTILGGTGGYRLGAAIGAVWRRPSSLKDLWALREHAWAAAERLARVLPGTIAQLP